ncbi:YbjN domain-containing protein, partial [Alphaproteobacteria bacterium]|nr:YbjN domain-containing protein [Alphaproteobacteria bacterium]
MSSAAQQVHIEHPIDLIEGLAASREWPFERGTEDDMNVCISGSHSDYHLAISWRPDLGGLHVACVL